MANVDVSQMDPGINPTKESHNEMGSPTMLVRFKESPAFTATCPSGVAQEYPSTTEPAPRPNVSEVRTKTLSPDIFPG